jgi:hypothetical protein
MKALALLLLLLLPACAVVGPPPVVERAPLIIEPTIGIYSKAEIDAINAENECRRIARTVLQAIRCGPNQRR